MDITREHIRKQVYELSAEDLKTHPIWEFCSDEEGIEGQDEATVKPSSDSELSGDFPGAHIVAADVTYADGSTELGYLYSCNPQDIGCSQPHVIAGSDQVNFWLGWLQFNKNPQEEIAANYRTLGKGSAAVFPISFKSRVNVSGAQPEITLNGFKALGLDKTIVTMN